jgi:hypothetical protein
MKVPLDALTQSNIGTKVSSLKFNTAPPPPVCQQNRITIYTYYNRAANPEHIPERLTGRPMPTTLRHIPHRTIARALGRLRHHSGIFGRKQVTRRHGTSCPLVRHLLCILLAGFCRRILMMALDGRVVYPESIYSETYYADHLTLPLERDQIKLVANLRKSSNFPFFNGNYGTHC